MRNSSPWLRRVGYLAFIVIVMLVVVPPQVFSQVFGGNISKTFLGPLSLNDGQILDITTSWRDGAGCRHCTKVEIKLFDTEFQTLASTSVPSGTLFSSFSIKRSNLPGTGQIDVFATIEVPQSQNHQHNQPTMSLTAYDQVTGLTDSHTSTNPWIDAGNINNRRTLLSNPVGLNGETKAVVTLVNTSNQSNRAQLFFVDPSTRNVLARLAPGG